MWWQATVRVILLLENMFSAVIYLDWKKIFAFSAPNIFNVLIAVTLKYETEWGHIFNSHFSSIFTNDPTLEHLLCLGNTHFCRWRSCNGCWQNCFLDDNTRNVFPFLHFLCDPVFKVTFWSSFPQRDGGYTSKAAYFCYFCWKAVSWIVTIGSLHVAGPLYVTAL